MPDRPTEHVAAVDFSIVVPTFNRPESLRACLDALVTLDYPMQDYEVIVVDDGGTAPLGELIRSYEDRLQITLLHQENAGPASARNAGANAATGRFVTFTDDDCTPADDWLRSLGERFRRQPECAVAGRTVNGLTRNIYATASQMLIDYLFDYYNQSSRQPSFATSSNLAFPRRAFIEIGGFDRSFPLAAAEDRELCDRWLHQHKALVYAPEVQVQHFHRMNLRLFLRQQRNYGRGACHYHGIRSQRAVKPIRVEPLSFYVNMICYPFGRRPAVQAFRIALLLALSQVMGATGFYLQKWRGGWSRQRLAAPMSS
jgi:glycosyltransferase involved in cell wall biosynthesis